MENRTIKANIYRGLGLMTQWQYIIVMESCYIVWLVMASVGLVSNVINIRVFLVIGVKDGVTVSFLALALFDLTYIISSLSFTVTMAFYVSELKFINKCFIDPFAICMFCGNVMNIINITNILTTTSLAVVRCLCVAKPLQFKNTVTKKRATLFMAGIAIFSSTIYIPILANMGMMNAFDKWTNTSRPTLWISPKRNEIKNNIWMVIDVVLPISTQLVIIICVVIMIRCLRIASTFRQSSSSAIALGDKGRDKYDSFQSNKVIDNDSISSTEKLTGKDLRVVQQVVLISVVYIVCNVAKILISLCTIIEPEFTVGKRYSNVYLSVNCLRKHFEFVNAAVNVFIYYKYNTRFRSVLCM